MEQKEKRNSAIEMVPKADFDVKKKEAFQLNENIALLDRRINEYENRI